MGQARNHGTYDERVAQALAAGRKKIKSTQNNPWLTRVGEGVLVMLGIDPSRLSQGKKRK